jgi:glycosyltransferase involved in cell wall biosynthesis
MTIPKIIHQIWIGDKSPPPLSLINTWISKNPDYEHILWTETEIEKRDFIFECQEKIDLCQELCGKADIMRLEILWKYGGIYLDADSICVESLDNFLLEKTAFATFENENTRKGLVANGNMGFVPRHPLCRDMIDWILSDESNEPIRTLRAWASVGPTLLTRFLNTGKYADFCVFPSHLFLPIHFTGSSYDGHRKVYAHQFWGSNYNLYDSSFSTGVLEIPECLKTPQKSVSLLITSYNTPQNYINECLESIKSQKGNFGIELVWINDGSSLENSVVLEKSLDHFRKTSRFIKVVYHRFVKNHGIAYCSNLGVLLCNNELIFRMDSDDIMYPDRIQKQLRFMESNPEIMICGGNARLFQINGGKREMIRETNFPQKLVRNKFLVEKPFSFMNHNTLCFRKTACLIVGNYDLSNRNIRNIYEDYDLESRFICKFGAIYNLHEVLVLYRIHELQITNGINAFSKENISLRREIVEKCIKMYKN